MGPQGSKSPQGKSGSIRCKTKHNFSRKTMKKLLNKSEYQNTLLIPSILHKLHIDTGWQ